MKKTNDTPMEDFQALYNRQVNRVYRLHWLCWAAKVMLKTRYTRRDAGAGHCENSQNRK